MTDSSDCSILFDIYKQRQKRALLNVPGPRVNIVSPYPKFTAFDLNMRRKAEILKYSNTTSSTKTNSLTKKQKWSLLVNGKIPPVSQQFIANCKEGMQNLDTMPMISTASGVPGPPTYLYLDPNIPLYNLKNSRSYAISPPSAAEWRSVTLNELEFLQLYGHTLPREIYTNFVESRTVVFGSVVFTDNVEPTSTYVIRQINSPIGLYMDMTYGFGITDPSGIYHAPVPFDPSNNNTLSVQITNVELQFYYNGSLFALKTTPTVSWKFQPLVLDCNQFLYTHNMNTGQYYGIQYVGMLVIQNIVLPCIPNSVFDIKALVTYEYDHSPIYHFDSFQTGIFPNLTSENVNVTIPPLKFTSSPPYGYMGVTCVPFSTTLPRGNY